MVWGLWLLSSLASLRVPEVKRVFWEFSRRFMKTESIWSMIMALTSLGAGYWGY